MFMRKNNKAPQRILFLYYDPHFAHAAFAKSINADFRPAPKIRSGEESITKNMKWGMQSIGAIFTLPRNYGTYFCEGTYVFPAIATKLGLLPKKAKIINILASPLLYYIKTGKIKGIKKWLALKMLEEVDSFVCLGKMEQDILKEFIPNAKSVVVYPFIRPKTYNKLIKLKDIFPKLDSHTILTIGTGDVYYKGIDLLIKAFKIAKEKIPSLKLNIVGKFDEEIYELADGIDGITVKGYVGDLVKEIKNAALYIHMGRGDTFPVSTLEAMLGGLPVIVSETTGIKEIIPENNKEMVVSLSPKRLAERMFWYFGLTDEEKKRISKQFILIGSKYNIEACVKDFKRSYEMVL